MTDPAKPAAEQAAEQAAAPAAQQAAAAGATPAQVEAEATQAAEQAAQQAAPNLSDEQLEKIGKAAGKAASDETIDRLKQLGALQDETETATVGTSVSQPPSLAQQPTHAGDGSPPEPAVTSPAPSERTQGTSAETPPATEGAGEEPPTRKSWARRFSGDRW